MTLRIRLRRSRSRIEAAEYALSAMNRVGITPRWATREPGHRHLLEHCGQHRPSPRPGQA